MGRGAHGRTLAPRQGVRTPQQQLALTTAGLRSLVGSADAQGPDDWCRLGVDGHPGWRPRTLIAISWDDTAGRDGRGAVRLIDQTLLPGTVVDRVTTTDDLVEAITVLAVRGAPALGVAGAMGVVVAMDEGLVNRTRPGSEPRWTACATRTAVNLAWGRPRCGR